MKRNHYIRLKSNLRRFFLFSACVLALIFYSGVTFGEITGTQGKDSAPNYRKASKRKVVSKLLLKADPKTIPSDGSTASTITATAKNKKGKPVKGVKIRFKVVGKGTLSPKVVKTGSDGKAKTTVTSTTPGSLTVTAKTKNAKHLRRDLVKIKVTKSSGGTGGGAANLSLNSNQSTIGNDGASTATFTVELVNGDNNAIPDATIKFKTDHGKITPSAVTDSSGLATAVLTSESVYTGTITVTATYDTDTVTTATIESVESSQTTSLSIVSDKTAISADGTSSAIISAQLKNEKNNPIVGATIEFSSENGGTITGSGTTDKWGIAEAELISNGYNGDIVVTASFNNKLTASITVKSVSAGVLNLAIKASPSNIISDGTDSSEIKLTITDASGSPVSGQNVTLRNALDADGDGTISIGDTVSYGTLSKTSDTTDSSGAITTTLTSVVTGSIVVEADANGSVKNVSVNALAVGGVKKASLSAGNDSVLVNTGSTAVTATFTNIIAGNAVFATSLGTLSSNVVVITDNGNGSGSASVTLNAGNLTGVSTVKVSYYDSVTDKKIESTANVTITSDTPASISVTATPDNIAKGSGISSIIAFVQDSDGNPVANIAVGFTLVSSPGGAHLEPAGTLIFTDANGMATAKFLAGKLSTGTFNNVKIDAYVVNNSSIKSSTLLTISGPDSKPLAPTGLAASVNLSSGVEVTLTWKDNSDNEVGFSIERAEQGSFYAEIATVGAGTSTYLDNDSKLVLGSVYYYRIRAFSKGALDSGDENSFSDYSQEISVDTLVETTVTISLTGNKLTIGNDGTSTATFTAELINSNNNPVSGLGVKFATDHGKITSASVTDSSGFATAVLTSEKNYVGTITVTAVYGTNTSTTATIDSVDLGQTTSLVISADKASISADGTSTAIISAQLRNEKNNPIVGATVEFASEKGTITGSATTDSWGIAKATLISENFNGDVVVTASYNNDEITAFVVVKFVAAGVLNLAITASPANITADGADTSQVKLTITDASGNPVSGQKIDFRNALDADADGTISAGDTIDYGTLSKTSGNTDSNGVITTTLSSTLTGSIVVEADANGSVKNVSVDAVAAGQVKSATLTAGASSILVNTGSTAITATFTNITSGNAVFAASLGTLSANVAAINGSGIASVTLSAGGLTGVSTVKVSYYDAVSDKRIESTINVTITSDTAASISVTSTPDNIANGSGVATITAFVKDSDGNPVANIGVGFTLARSPGGDEHLESDGTLLFTDANGIATVKFLAGELTTPIFNGVKIDAYVATNTSIKSSTFLTISGAPFHVAIVFNDYLTPIILNGDATLSCPIAALVTDIHGNPVADGTNVSFGVATTQIVSNDKVLLSSEDINGNGSLDPGEDLNGNRVIDIVEDINGNGVLDTAEDLNNNGVLDSGEDANNNGRLDIDEDVNANGSLDVNISADAIVTKSSTTVNGVATGELTYGVNFVERFQVHLTAESVGVTDGDGQYLVLPLRISGFNGTKQSDFVTNVNIDTVNLPAPTGLAGTAVSSSQIDLTWNDNSSAETAFSIERKDGTFGSFAEIATVVANTVSYSDTALDANTPYYYRVRALNQLINTFSAFSPEVTVTTLNEKPDAPTGLEATAISTNQINLTWNDWSTNESVFAVLRSTGISTITTEIGTVGKNIESYSDNTVSKNTTYYYQVVARNSVGDSSQTNTASATTPDTKPVAPTGLAATVVNFTNGVEVTLTWNDNSDNEVGFSIERAAQGSFYAEIAIVGAGTSTYLDDDSTLVPGDAYYYRIRAFGKGALDSGDENSFSDYSQEISVDTLVEATVTISLTGNKLSIGNDGSSTATFTAELINSNNNPVSGLGVKFATDHGKITSASVTDSSGFATAVLTSEKNYVGTITVTAVYGTNTSTTATIDSVNSGQTTSLVISADKASISANGTSTAIISAQLRNEKNNPIVGASVEFASEKGTITGSATTDSWGIAKAMLISENFNGDVVVTASYNNDEITAFVVVKFIAAGVLNLAITASPTNITADGADTSQVKLTITDVSGNPVSGQKIDFRNALDVDSDGTISVGDTIDYGTLSKTSGTTDSNGIITTTLSSTLTGSIVVEADANGSVKNVSVDAVAAGQVKSASLTTGASSILVNTGSTAITATFTNITSGNAVFAASLGSLSANVEAINGSGIASVTLSAGGLTGVSTVKVSYYDAVSDKRIESTINVTITSDTPTAISVRATPDNIANGSGVATITAFVQDSDGNPVTNIGVGFTLVNSPGGDEHLVPDGTLLFTDANGIATVKFLAGELTTAIFNGVKVDAYVATNTSIKSSTFLTISGAPFHVAIVFNDYLTPLNLNGDGTLSCPIAALVTDIHGNPVADGTLVSFGVATTQIVALESDIGFDVNGDSDISDRVLLSSEDINGNGSLDSGEDLNGNRVVDIVEDINGNGVLDIAEDLNNNGVLDAGEDANNNGLLDINEDVNANGTLDVNISADAIATKSSTTAQGVATGSLRYGVNFVERFQVRLTAESGGVTDGDGQYVILPARDPNTGWNITKQSTFITNINIDTANLPAPTGLAGTASSSNQIDITWNDTSSSETAFSIERKEGKFGSFQEIATVVSNTVTYSDIALDANTPYYYRLRALNQLNNTFSAFSPEVTVTTLNEKPDAPTGLDATAISTNQINLTWNEWSSNESIFAIFRSNDISAITTEIGTVGKNIESYSDNTASKNTTYYYQIVARNSAGDSSRTNIASATTPDTKPVAPTGLAATVALSTGVEVTLTWNDNSDNEVGFSIERAKQGSFYAEIAAVGVGTSTYLDDDSSIVPGDIYYYRVRAFSKGALESGDENSFSDYSQEISVDTLVETFTPNAPTNLSATSPASTQVNLTWDDNSLNETSFAVSRATSSGGPFTEIDTTSANSTSYSDTSASANTTYYYKVVARNAAGDSSATNTVSETTVDFQPQAPSGLTATASTTNKVEINLNWTDNSSNEVGFSIERAEESTTNNGIGDYKVIFIAEANATSYTDDDSTLTDKAYYYRVRAFSNGAVYSVYSDEVSAAPITVSAPTGLSGTTGTTTGVNLTWTDASSNETAFAIEFKKSSTGAWSEVVLVSPNNTGVTDLMGTTFVVGDLYIFRVRAFNGIYYSKYSNEIAAVVK